MEQIDHTQRLRALANPLLDAYEAIELPKTYADADRAAKALISIGKAIALANAEPPEPKVKRPAPVKVPSPTSALLSEAQAIERAAKALSAGRPIEEVERMMPPDPTVRRV